VKISFLIQNFYGVGGTNTAIHNLAKALCERHEVEVVSVFRRQDLCAQDHGDSYSVRPLVDVRPGRPDSRSPDRTVPSALVPPAEEFYSQYSKLTDDRMRAFFRRADADIIITTRPSLNLVMAKLGRAHCLKIAQEHMTQDLVNDAVQREVRAHYSGIDASVCLTVADAQHLERNIADIASKPLVASIPNAVPRPRLQPADGNAKLVVAAGRLADVKRYDRLIRAFDGVADRYPDWKLRIYGAGPEYPALRRLIQYTGRSEEILLMGRTVPLQPEWVKGSIAASTSEHESFGMTIVEAMSCGLPVISTDCPVGPGEIIRSGQDGILTPVGDVGATSDALAHLMGADTTRIDMGRAARVSAQRFDPENVAQSYEELFEALLRNRQGKSRSVQLRRTGTVLRRIVSSTAHRAGRLGRDYLHTPDGKAPTLDVRTELGALRFLLEDAQADSVVLRRRGSDRSEDITLPLQPRGDVETSRSAVLDSQAVTAEGRWNVYVQMGDRHVRALSGYRDTRDVALGDAPLDGQTVNPRLPYTTEDGFLGVRSWLRHGHAECIGLNTVEDQLVLTIKTFGLPAPTKSVVAIRRNHSPSGEAAHVERACRPVGTDVVEASVPLSELVRRRLTRHDDWDFWLEVLSGQRIRIARLFDDVPDHKRVYVQPLLTVEPPDELPWVEESPTVPVRVRSYFAIDSGVSAYVAD
jgi:glycosyltransferase involved in cell wall biosynthesis